MNQKSFALTYFMLGFVYNFSMEFDVAITFYVDIVVIKGFNKCDLCRLDGSVHAFIACQIQPSFYRVWLRYTVYVCVQSGHCGVYVAIL